MLIQNVSNCKKVSLKIEIENKMKIVDKKITDLIPYENNTRFHSKNQINQIANSIKEFGFNVPVLIDEENIIMSGHGRLEAAKNIGLEIIPTICIDSLTDNQKKAFIIADNKIASNSEWEESFLKIELEILKNNDFDLLFTGFDNKELFDMFDEKLIEKKETLKKEKKFRVLITIPISETLKLKDFLKSIKEIDDIKVFTAHDKKN